MAGSIKIGKWEIAPQTGTSGSIPVSHKLVDKHTGRNKYTKLVRASISNPKASKDSIETLEALGMAPFLKLDSSQSEIAYNVTSTVISGTSNAAKFRVSSTGKSITLITNTGYTVSGNEGTFSTGFGEQSEGNISIKVSFTSNNTTAPINIPINIEYWDGTKWSVGGTFTIIQSSADASVNFTINPSTLSTFANTGGKQTVSITSNVAYSIETEGGTETSWITLSRLSGSEGTSSLDITASAQVVGADQRELNIKFKNNVTGSVIGTLSVTQAQGEDFAISWENDTLTFTNDEVGTIKTNTLTANADWQIEEKLS